MKKILSILSLIFLLGISYQNASAQCDSIANICNKNMAKNYISDGQSYRALLNNQEIAEFKAVFYGNSTYRISGCSGFTDGNLIFSVFDQEKNLLFTNADQKNAPYWDLKFGNTLSCTIEAQLNTTNQASGCAVMLIGFKQ
jgi:hypothetical protein